MTDLCSYLGSAALVSSGLLLMASEPLKCPVWEGSRLASNILAVGKYLLPKNRAKVLITLRSKGMRSLPSPRV